MTNAQVTDSLESTAEFIRTNVKATFKPVAYYDDSLDCLRVITRDCSVCELRVNEYLTIAEDNYPPSPGEKYVGFTIKGIRHFLRARKLAQASAITQDRNMVDVGEVLEFMVSGELPKLMDGPEARNLVDFAVGIAFNILKGVPEKQVSLRIAA